jgi:hypothetical protein
VINFAIVINNTVAIVVPLHKAFSKLSENEKLALESSCRQLDQYHHILVGPKQLKWKEYQNFYADKGINIQIVKFKAIFFLNIGGYNRLLRSLLFYKNFVKYEYILIFQTDAYVFKNELEFWCSKGYDYIGGPWLNSANGCDSESRIIGAGNGGFSLRRIEPAIKLLKRIRALNLIRKIWRVSYLNRIVQFPIFLRLFLIDFKVVNFDQMDKLSVHAVANEDQFWCQIVANTFSDYNVSNIEDAIKFSFDVNPSLLFKLNNKQLPFGCHGWLRTDFPYEGNLSFWRSIIASETDK